MGYPFAGRPVYLALAPLTHAAGVLCFPVMALGGEIVVMPKPDLASFLSLIGRHRVTHTFLPPTLIYMLLGHQDLAAADLEVDPVHGGQGAEALGDARHVDRQHQAPAGRAAYKTYDLRA